MLRPSKLGLALTLLAAGTAGAGVFEAPEGCALQYTVQARDCTANQHYVCDADAPGDQWLATFDADGLRYVARIDAETRWMESHSMRSGISETLDPEAPGHASLSTLLRSGTDEFDFWTRTNDGGHYRYTGRDSLTGETVTIDGVTLEKTRFTLTMTDAGGETILTRQGQQFISRDKRRFFGGIETGTDWTGETVRTDTTPVTFRHPGQPGFGNTTPQYGCDMMMAQSPQGKTAL